MGVTPSKTYLLQVFAILLFRVHELEKFIASLHTFYHVDLRIIVQVRPSILLGLTQVLGTS